MVSADPIRIALETALAAMSPALETAWENEDFVPTAGTPYQRVNLLRAQPDDSEIGPLFVEQGYLQVTLCYPAGAGPADVEARASLLRQAFRRGSSFAAGGLTVIITRTPQLVPPQLDGDRYQLPARIPFRASVQA